MQEYMQRKQAEQIARARAERIQTGAAVQQRVQTAKEEADKAREVSHSSGAQEPVFRTQVYMVCRYPSTCSQGGV